MNDRLCGCTFIHAGRSLEAGMASAVAFGFRTVDIAAGSTQAHWPVAQVIAEPQRVAEQVRSAAHKFDLRVNECLTLDLGPPINHPDRAVRRQTAAQFPALARFAAAAGLRSVLLIPGPVHDQVGAARSLDLAVEALGELAAIATDHGVRLHVEADCDSCANTPELALQLCQRTPGIRLTLDYSHFVYLGIDQRQVDALLAHAGHVHIRQAAADRIIAPAAEPTIDFARIVRCLDELRYNGLFCIEYLQIEALAHLGIDCDHETRMMIDLMERILT